MLKRIMIVLLGMATLAVIGIFALAYRPAIGPVAVPAASSFAPGLIARGQQLAGAGYCATCHTRRGGEPYAGGLPFPTPFGTMYSTNITPDPVTGIGQWSEEAFRRAMHQGVARDGSHLFPTFPYQHFNLITDEDISALYAFIMTRKPVVAEARKSDIPFPLNVRALQAGWKLLNFREGQYGPVDGKDAQWNRGAYLAEGLGHCSACHSPRNKLGAEKSGDQRYAGAEIDHWYAPPLTAANPAAVPWTPDELYQYLREGATPLHGVATDVMSDVIQKGLSELPDQDIRALATYFADRMGTSGASIDRDVINGELAKANLAQHSPQRDGGQALYLAACSSCHYNNDAGPQLQRPELGINTAITADDPTTLLRVILQGVSVDQGLPGVMMPGFGHSMSDAQVAQLAAWLRSSRSDRPAWPDLEQRVTRLRKDLAASER
ncbi:c-type cytochrome [Pseudoxanthomonas dokdonensis]|uniref:Aldehyde dehydrogenase n=1 Tax=Pseudoxanthomonas dokdonensis TaxID=344882 RepID=A0A0R0CGR7_9GAMM|nr:c-type cytochrome [Pseudoxanthomonas dokdonensis]KRG68278.1 aldehyde dehydrogenase [Pseudoxanthomonas dokdonensis]